MCHTGSYLCGMGAGLMVGAVVCAAVLSRPDSRKRDGIPGPIAVQ